MEKITVSKATIDYMIGLIAKNDRLQAVKITKSIYEHFGLKEACNYVDKVKKVEKHE